ncbi:hypothetical protein [Actinoplanes xinjiangensis]|uniref:hypothetical protein n=1 Tax=Actinoplanes xinjiangensis TaxID=512350 RepID=UPI0034282039
MTTHHDDRPGDDGTPMAPMALVRPQRSRIKRVAGVVGLAAVLGSGAYFTTLSVTTDNEAERREVTALGTPHPASTVDPRPSVSGSAGTSDGTPQPGKTGGAMQAAKAEPSFEEPAERVRKAREAAAKDGVEITRPLPARTENPAGEAAARAAEEVTIGSAKEGGTMRIVTVRGDLTGQREIGWVAGGVKKHGEVECSQRFRLYNEQEPKTRPNLLVCWRTSAERSVIVVDTKIGGRPAVAKSLAVIEREWRKLG